MDCLACGHANRAEARFCDACGSALVNGTTLGTTLGAATRTARSDTPRSYTPAHLAQKILTSRAALEGERKQVTVLFCDLADSTALAQRLGAEAMHEVLNRFFELALAEVHEVEGTINQFLGDGFMALFGAPLAHEDHVRRAAACALAITNRLREAAADPRSPLAQLVLRMGLNTGAVVVGKIGDNLRMDYTAVGDTTNIAARLQALAAPGQICVSDSVRAAIEAHCEFEPLGPKALKGVSEPVLVHRLLRARSSRSARSAREGAEGGSAGIGSVLVGRDAELAAADQTLLALGRGEGGVLMLIGEPGAGKSRLVAELRRRHASTAAADPATPAGLRWLEGRTLSFGRHLAYWPFIEILRGAFGIADDSDDASDEDSTRLRLEQGLAALLGADAAADALPYVATVLALKLSAEQQARLGYLDGPAMKRQVFACLRQVFEALARERPTLLLLEDWHWADPSSIEMAEHLLPLAQTLPLLLLLPTRPGQEGPAAQTASAAAERLGTRMRTLSLAPLAHDASAQLVENLVGAGTLPHALREQILWRTEGNPLFIEEVVRALVADGTLVRAEDDEDDEAAGPRWQLTRQPEEVKLPDTLHALILARIDRLDDDVKHALKLASVIGRTFFDRVLGSISQAQQALPAQLGELERAELIRDKQRQPEAEHIFKHALIQEAAYSSILAENRRSIHGQVARTIERLFADRLDEFASLLAHHYTCAEDWDKAQEFLFKAGDQADRMASDHEALEHLRRAEAAYVKAFGDRLEPLARATLARKIGAALFGTGQNEAAHAQMRQALGHLGFRYPTTVKGVRQEILRQMLGHCWRTLRRRFGVPVARKLKLEVAEEISTLAHTMSWVDYFVNKERMLLDALLELRAGETSRHALAESRGTASVGFGWMTFGAHRIARRYHSRAIALAQRAAHPAAIAFGWLSLAFVDFYDGRWDESEARFGNCAVTYREAGDIHRWGSSQVMLTFVVHARGKLEQTLAIGEGLIRAGDDAADPQLVSWGLQSSGYAMVATGPLHEAEARLRRGRELAARIPAWDNHLYQSSLLAKCLVLQGRVDEAVPIVEAALAVMKREQLRLPFDRIEMLTAAATLHLALAERAQRTPALAGTFPAALAAARRACAEALACARRMPCWLAEALRLHGNADWLAGEHARANKHWRESLDFAERAAFPIERGRTMLVMGQRLGDAELVGRATTILRQAGAWSYVPRNVNTTGADDAVSAPPPELRRAA